MRRRFLLVHNPIAGIKGLQLAREVAAGLTQLGGEVFTHEGSPEALPSLLREKAAGLDAVVAAGGDGTVRALAAQLTAYDLPLGVVPMGTGNVLAHELGLPRSAVGLVHLLMHGPVVTIDGALANGEPFFLMAGVGFDGIVISALDTSSKRRLGKAAYAGPIMRTLARPRSQLALEIDGQPTTAQWLVVANARRYAGPFVIAPDAGLERPGLTAVVMRAPGRVTQLRQLLALGLGRLHRAPGVAMIRCNRVVVTSDAPVLSQIDGDPFAPTPIDITAGGVAVRLIVPESYASRIKLQDAS